MSFALSAWNLSVDDFPADGFSSDQLEFLLQYAILAPSPHNTQPWRFRINSMDVEIFPDRRRRLPVIDPLDRELTMSCGAALFNLRVAAEYLDHKYRVEILPDLAQPDLLARFHLGLRDESGASDVSLFHAINQRHTNRQAFRPDPVPEEILAALSQAAVSEGAALQFIPTEEARQALADLVSEADQRQWADRMFRKELAHWVRSKPELCPDGLAVHALGISDWLSFAGPSLIRTFDRGGGQAARDHEIALQSPVLAVLTTDNDNVSSWIAAGQALQAVLLLARSEDLWASFLCQPLEVADLRVKVAELLGGSGCPQAILRLGYAEPAGPTGRRPVRDLLIRHQMPHA